MPERPVLYRSGRSDRVAGAAGRIRRRQLLARDRLASSSQPGRARRSTLPGPPAGDRDQGTHGAPAHGGRHPPTSAYRGEGGPRLRSPEPSSGAARAGLPAFYIPGPFSLIGHETEKKPRENSDPSNLGRFAPQLASLAKWIRPQLPGSSSPAPRIQLPAPRLPSSPVPWSLSPGPEFPPHSQEFPPHFRSDIAPRLENGGSV